MTQRVFRAQFSDEEEIIIQFHDENEIHSIDSLNKRGYTLVILDIENEIAVFNYNSSDKTI